MMNACMGGGCGAGGHGLAAAALMAGAAALGYWVLHQAGKDAGAVRRAGQVVGWVLVVVGLGGFLCGALSHGRRMMACAGGATRMCVHETMDASQPMGALQMPPGHPPVGDVSGGEAPPAPAAKVKISKKKGK